MVAEMCEAVEAQAADSGREGGWAEGEEESEEVEGGSSSEDGGEEDGEEYEILNILGEAAGRALVLWAWTGDEEVDVHGAERTAQQQRCHEENPSWVPVEHVRRTAAYGRFLAKRDGEEPWRQREAGGVETEAGMSGAWYREEASEGKRNRLREEACHAARVLAEGAVPGKEDLE